MSSVRLGFKAFDAHELLPHFVARARGLYEQHDLTVNLLDTVTTPEDTLSFRILNVACGSALCSRIKGVPQSVVFVTSPQPMFWLYTRELEHLTDLKERVIAGYPPGTPPFVFLSAHLRREGLEPIEEVHRESVSNDLARLEMLRHGDADAALLSSALPPRLTDVHDLRSLLFLGDGLRVPTSGLAVHEKMLRDHSDVVRSMIRVFHESLQIIHGEPDVARAAMEEYLALDEEDARAVYERLRPLFSETGKIAPGTLEEPMRLIARELEVKTVPEPDDMYHFSLLDEVETDIT